MREIPGKGCRAAGTGNGSFRNSVINRSPRNKVMKRPSPRVDHEEKNSRGRSMEPTMPDFYTHYEQEFRDGEVLDIDVGDIIVFRDKFARTILHRVVDVLRDEETGTIVGYHTKGDANEIDDREAGCYDDWIRPDDVLSKVLLGRGCRSLINKWKAENAREE